MSVIEVIAGSPNGFDEAVKNALEEAQKSMQNIKSIYVKEMNANVEGGKITSYAVNAKISFEVNK